MRSFCLEQSYKPQRRGRIGENPIDSVQVLDVEGERNSKVLGREKQFFTMKSRGTYDDDGASQNTAQDEESKDDVECPNCKETIPGKEAVAHTIQCFRNATKCKICKEVIQKDRKREHLEKWRNEDVS